MVVQNLDFFFVIAPITLVIEKNTTNTTTQPPPDPVTHTIKLNETTVTDVLLKPPTDNTDTKMNVRHLFINTIHPSSIFEI